MRIVSKRLIQVIAPAIMLTGASLPVRADFIMFDPDGLGNNTKQAINTFQFGVGNALAQGAVPFIAGDPFQFFYQAQLNSVVLDTANQQTPVGLNATAPVGGVTPFEIT